MNSLKEKGFIAWLSKVLNVENEEQLDAEISKLGRDKLNQLANQFETQIWPIMEKELTLSAKKGSKLDYIVRLNGDCPEGYEVEKFLAGGKPCSRCKKKAVQMKSGSVMDNIKSEIESKKCGGKTKKKKMQEGGKYNESEHATLLEKKRKGALSDKETTRLQELNRNSGHHEDGWEPKRKVTVKPVDKETAKKASENIKKHLNGGTISKFFRGGGTPKVKEVSSFDYEQSNDPRHIAAARYNAGRGSLGIQTNTYRIPFENYTLYAPYVQNHIDTINKRQQDKLANEELPQPTTSSLGGGIYEYLVNKGAQSLASFAARKKLAEQWGINNYTGTAEQNALLQRMFEHQFALAESSNNTRGLRKGIDY